MNAKPVKIIGLLSMIAGLIMLVAGAITWGTVTSQLKSENITVPADAASNAGKQVAGPFTAWSQAEIIKTHALAGAEGKTYAELGAEIKKAEAAGDTAAAEKYTEARTSAMNGSFLRASLFTSIVSYGISALVMGLGLLSTLVGWALTRIAKLLDSARATGAGVGATTAKAV
ncbi:aromatic ring-opening dioxygenase LigA [Luteococcus sp. OSA5]|uniref:aromatic ring-opening dioxygenase LigA n=1 Tax=Luteococcus sp. OSA5 TaxID=3401630 RepID=UPI003B433877